MFNFPFPFTLSHAHTHACTDIYTYTLHTHTQAHTYASTRMHMSTYMYTHTCTHTHVHAHTRTRTHTYIHKAIIIKPKIEDDCVGTHSSMYKGFNHLSNYACSPTSTQFFQSAFCRPRKLTSSEIISRRALNQYWGPHITANVSICLCIYVHSYRPCSGMLGY